SFTSYADIQPDCGVPLSGKFFQAVLGTMTHAGLGIEREVVDPGVSGKLSLGLLSMALGASTSSQNGSATVAGDVAPRTVCATGSYPVLIMSSLTLHLSSLHEELCVPPEFCATARRVTCESLAANSSAISTTRDPRFPSSERPRPGRGLLMTQVSRFGEVVMIISFFASATANEKAGGGGRPVVFGLNGQWWVGN